MQVTWNPFSRKQTKQVVKMLDHILVYLPTDHPKAQASTPHPSLTTVHHEDHRQAKIMTRESMMGSPN